MNNNGKFNEFTDLNDFNSFGGFNGSNGFGDFGEFGDWRNHLPGSDSYSSGDLQMDWFHFNNFKKNEALDHVNKVLDKYKALNETSTDQQDIDQIQKDIYVYKEIYNTIKQNMAYIEEEYTKYKKCQIIIGDCEKKISFYKELENRMDNSLNINFWTDRHPLPFPSGPKPTIKYEKNSSLNIVNRTLEKYEFYGERFMGSEFKTEDLDFIRRSIKCYEEEKSLLEQFQDKLKEEYTTYKTFEKTLDECKDKINYYIDRIIKYYESLITDSSLSVHKREIVRGFLKVSKGITQQEFKQFERKVGISPERLIYEISIGRIKIYDNHGEWEKENRHKFIEENIVYNDDDYKDFLDEDPYKDPEYQYTYESLEEDRKASYEVYNEYQKEELKALEMGQIIDFGLKNYGEKDKTFLCTKELFHRYIEKDVEWQNVSKFLELSSLYIDNPDRNYYEDSIRIAYLYQDEGSYRSVCGFFKKMTINLEEMFKFNTQEERYRRDWWTDAYDVDMRGVRTPIEGELVYKELFLGRQFRVFKVSENHLLSNNNIY